MSPAAQCVIIERRPHTERIRGRFIGGSRDTLPLGMVTVHHAMYEEYITC